MRKPRKPKRRLENRLTAYLAVYLTPREKRFLRERAEANGTSMAKEMRGLLLREMGE